MTTTQDSTLIFKDQAGDYYLVPQAMFERARVPAERTAEVERFVAAASSEQDDTQGHLVPLLIVSVGLAGGVWAAALIGNSGDVPLYHILEPYTR